MAEYPKDQFDDLPIDASRVGAHRGAPRPGAGWIVFAWAALATGLLVGAGVVAVSIMGGAQNGETGAAVVSTPEPTAEPVTDPTTLDDDRAISITILNGTPAVDLQTVAQESLEDDEWVVDSASDAQSREHESTVVYYGTEENEDVARGVAIALTVGTVRLDDSLQGAPVKVVLGTDYQAMQEAE